MAAKDPFSRKIVTYDLMVTRLLTFCSDSANRARLGIKPGEVNTANGYYTTFETAYAVSQIKASASASDRLATKMARKDLTKNLRPFVQKWFYKNTNATTQDIVDAGLDLILSRRTPYGKPAMIPQIEAAAAPAYTIKGTFLQDDHKTKAKPEGVVFCRIRYWVGPNKPDNPNDWLRFKDSSKNPFSIQFSADLAGKEMWLAACYVGTDGQEGDYSPSVKRIVPGA